MSLLPLLSSASNVSAAAGVLSAVHQASQGRIEVPELIYAIFCVVLGFCGVWLARLVTIENENQRLGRRQTFRETGPLTFTAVLIVCPLILHYKMAAPLAALLGLSFGYSVRVVLKILGNGAISAAQAFTRQSVNDLGLPPVPPLDAPGARPPAVILPPQDNPPAVQQLVRKLDDVPGLPPTPKSE